MKDFLIAWKEAAPAAGAITAIITAFVALTVFRYTRASNRRRATLDMVMKTLLDDSAQKRYYEFKTILRKDQDPDDCFKISCLLEPQNAASPDRETMLQQINIYELTSLGIKRGVFDEAFYKRWFHNQFMKDYETSLDFIKGAQDRKPSIYCEYSALYGKWLKNGHPEISPSRWKMAYWALTKQGHKIDEARAATRAR